MTTNQPSLRDIDPHDRSLAFQLRRRIRRIEQAAPDTTTTWLNLANLAAQLRALVRTIEAGLDFDEDAVEAYLAQADRQLKPSRDLPRHAGARRGAHRGLPSSADIAAQETHDRGIEHAVAIRLRDWAAKRPEAVRDAIGTAANLLEAGQL